MENKLDLVERIQSYPVQHGYIKQGTSRVLSVQTSFHLLQHVIICGKLHVPGTRSIVLISSMLNLHRERPKNMTALVVQCIKVLVHPLSRLDWWMYPPKIADKPTLHH